MSLPKWPTQKPEHLGLANSAYWEAYERARAEAAIARLRYLTDLLQTYYTHDEVREALAAVGEIPHD